jgi:hypothetical protein
MRVFYLLGVYVLCVFALYFLLGVYPESEVLLSSVMDLKNLISFLGFKI